MGSDPTKGEGDAMFKIHSIALLDECWVQGCLAGLDDLDEAANPYEVGTKEFQFWCDGWWTVNFDLPRSVLMNESDSEDQVSAMN